MCRFICCFAVTLPPKLTMYIAQEVFFLLMVMAILFACALFLVASLILLHAAVRSAVLAMHTWGAKLFGSRQDLLEAKRPLRHLLVHR